MYINNCGCSKYINIPEEYPINYTPSSIKIKLPESSNKDYRDLKCKIITEGAAGKRSVPCLDGN